MGAPRTNTSQPGVIEGGAVYDCQTSGVGGIINCVNMPFDRDGKFYFVFVPFSRQDISVGVKSLSVCDHFNT